MTEADYLAPTITELASYCQSDTMALSRAHDVVVEAWSERFAVSRVRAHALVSETDPSILWPELQAAVLTEMRQRGVLPPLN